MPNWKMPPRKWIVILAFLSKCPDVRVGNDENCRRFIEAMMWVARAGAPWRMLPSEYGNWNSVYKRFDGGRVTADKWYDSDKFVALIEASGMEAAIPPRSNRKTPRAYDSELYKERSAVERFFAKFKNYRKIACRFDKMSLRYFGFIHFIRSGGQSDDLANRQTRIANPD